MSRQATLLGVLAALLVAALWWLFLYSPGQEELAQVQDEVRAAEDEAVALEARIARLEAVRARAPETEAAIATLRSFVPDEPALPGALRQIQASADDAGVELTVVTTGRPEVVDEGAGLYAAAIALNAEGAYFQVVDFLRRLEDPEITSRGITFSALTTTTGDYPTLIATISGQMYSVLEPVPEVAAVEDQAETADADAGTDGEAATEAPTADGDGSDT